MKSVSFRMSNCVDFIKQELDKQEKQRREEELAREFAERRERAREKFNEMRKIPPVCVDCVRNLCADCIQKFYPGQLDPQN